MVCEGGFFPPALKCSLLGWRGAPEGGQGQGCWDRGWQVLFSGPLPGHPGARGTHRGTRDSSRWLKATELGKVDLEQVPHFLALGGVMVSRELLPGPKLST